MIGYLPLRWRGIQWPLLSQNRLYPPTQKATVSQTVDVVGHSLWRRTMNAERVPFEALKERSRRCFGGFRLPARSPASRSLAEGRRFGEGRPSEACGGSRALAPGAPPFRHYPNLPFPSQVVSKGSYNSDTTRSRGWSGGGGFGYRNVLLRFVEGSGIVSREASPVRSYEAPPCGEKLHFPKTSFNRSVTRAAGSVRIFFSSWATT